MLGTQRLFAPPVLSSGGTQTDHFEEVMIFGVSEVPTVPVEEVKKFLKHIDKDMKARLF